MRASDLSANHGSSSFVRDGPRPVRFTPRKQAKERWSGTVIRTRLADVKMFQFGHSIAQFVFNSCCDDSVIGRLLGRQRGCPHLFGKYHPRSHLSPGGFGSQTALPDVFKCRRLGGGARFFCTRQVSIEFSMAYWFNHCRLLQPPVRSHKRADWTSCSNGESRQALWMLTALVLPRWSRSSS